MLVTTAERNRLWLLLAIVLGAAWWFTRALPPWGDEAHFLNTIRAFGQGISVDLLRTYPEMSGPLPFALFAWWGGLVGFGTAGLRGLSALIAFATLVLYHSTLEQHGLHGRLKYLLLVLFAANPYFVGLSVFVFTDMLALFGMAWCCTHRPQDALGVPRWGWRWQRSPASTWRSSRRLSSWRRCAVGTSVTAYEWRGSPLQWPGCCR